MARCFGDQPTAAPGVQLPSSGHPRLSLLAALPTSLNRGGSFPFFLSVYFQICPSCGYAFVGSARGRLISFCDLRTLGEDVNGFTNCSSKLDMVGRARSKQPEAWPTARRMVLSTLQGGRKLPQAWSSLSGSAKDLFLTQAPASQSHAQDTMGSRICLGHPWGHVYHLVLQADSPACTPS